MPTVETQQTLARSVERAGVGVHSGRPVTVRLCPAPDDHGVTFVRTDLPGRPEIPARVENIAPDGLMRQTSLALAGRPDARVETVEHVLAALNACGVDNCRVEIDAAEAPLFDGSARDMAEAIDEAGLTALKTARRLACLSAPIAFSRGEVELVATPSDQLRLTFFLDYSGTLIGRQALSVVVTPDVFRRQIAPARTFCLKHEIDFLREKGLIKGGSLDMAIIVDGDRLYNGHTTLRFEDEFVRHKILDLLGDLYLLGRPLRAHVLAVKSGHATHAAFVAQLKQAVGDDTVAVYRERRT